MRRLCLLCRPGDAMEIRNISFVNARTKVVNCTVQNVAVDITVNQVGGYILQEGDWTKQQVG